MNPKNTPKAATVITAVDYLDQPGLFVSTATRFDLNAKRFNRIIEAGSNPYEVVGLMKP